MVCPQTIKNCGCSAVFTHEQALVMQSRSFLPPQNFEDTPIGISGYGKSSPKVCQLRAPIRKKDRVPIIPIPRGYEFRFSHLVMDCIDCIEPMFPKGDVLATQPKFNFALVVVDLFPMAYGMSVEFYERIMWMPPANLYDFLNTTRNKFDLWN